ncbi:MAG: tRNA (adenosine(37)-N6)-threonylcarbamoyltransferase complex dimerization subunit type 1 TsaB [Lachnospiraceae bacterium]|jgi:tRNA threonylcarbamoyladenosine biosynthesis protein TsaB|nr:tRNA (adenosine(37)-N6)-threonylcarbamoyltransferase complex dimerization subunit type 1 TsaB [Lachnospiraceae bacterium]MCI9101046.1 tRNA (adenosine(37)-N6)-threonylcarbamoyltransferase complex dimerization subunit type 1 TsaB [Lachnospiraceae bacterium]MCI9358824.1 tRNA (adenosine(37)-N6)-threonylcarbamoyltransferase complex dimerization subunit type 1 TsaB [Lachnospiraceae bacterium]
MKILALDSSGMAASVAVVEDENMLAEYTVNYKKTHSQTLLPMLDAAVQMVQLKLDTIDAIAVASGPGSFTGLRIGSATAKGLGLALDKPIIGVPTTQAMAYNLFGAGGVVCPIMDARRNQVYTGIYGFKNGHLEILEDQMAADIYQVIEKLNALKCPVIFTGDGISVYREVIDQNIQVPAEYAPAHLNRQRASAVAALAMEYLKEGRVQTAAEHRPEYLRMSQAERERQERLAQKEGSS